MDPDYPADAERSAIAFRDVVWPAIGPLLGGGKIAPVEAGDTVLRAQLDQLAGIDAWQICPGHGVRGIASRVQFVKSSFDTFSLRYMRKNGQRTEVSKRLEAIRHPELGLLIPHYTVQGYVDSRNGRLLAAAAVETVIIYPHAVACLAEGGPCRLHTNPNDGTLFIGSPWKHLIALGIKVLGCRKRRL